MTRDEVGHSYLIGLSVSRRVRQVRGKFTRSRGRHLDEVVSSSLRVTREVALNTRFDDKATRDWSKKNLCRKFSSLTLLQKLYL